MSVTHSRSVALKEWDAIDSSGDTSWDCYGIVGNNKVRSIQKQNFKSRNIGVLGVNEAKRINDKLCLWTTPYPEIDIQEEDYLYYDGIVLKEINDFLEVNTNKFKSLFEEIEKSKYILNLKDDWDDNNSKGYEWKTWQKAAGFLTSFFEWVYVRFPAIIMPVPKIYHGPEGTIDILWKSDKYRLIINIPGSTNNIASFYGDDYTKSNHVEDTFDISKLEEVHQVKTLVSICSLLFL